MNKFIKQVLANIIEFFSKFIFTVLNLFVNYWKSHIELVLQTVSRFKKFMNYLPICLILRLYFFFLVLYTIYDMSVKIY